VGCLPGSFQFFRPWSPSAWRSLLRALPSVAHVVSQRLELQRSCRQISLTAAFCGQEALHRDSL
jgi:hypothetical protein